MINSNRRRRRIGIMGGTFDPPHLAHVLPVEFAIQEFDLDFVWFIPALIPPHKQSDHLTDAYHRTAMLALALQHSDRLLISTIELVRGMVSYTIDTVQELKRNIDPDDRLFLILGSDSFLEIHTWRSYEHLLELCDLIIINRGVSESDLKANLEQLENVLRLDLKQTIHFSKFTPLLISSTQVREAVRFATGVSDLIIPEVRAYIGKHGLYQGGNVD